MCCVLILRSPLFARREENDAVSVYYSLADSPSLLLHLFNQSELEKANEKNTKRAKAALMMCCLQSVWGLTSHVWISVCAGLWLKLFSCSPATYVYPNTFIHSHLIVSVQMHFWQVAIKVKCHTMNKHSSGANIFVRPKTFILFYDYI